MTKLLLLILLATMIEPSGPGARIDPARAARNYEAVSTGRLRVQQLSALEQAEVAQLDRELRRRRQATTPGAERCRAREQRAAGTPPSELDRRIISLRCD